MHVTRVAFVPDGADAHLGFGHVFLGEAGGVEHGLGGSLGGWLGQSATIMSREQMFRCGKEKLSSTDVAANILPTVLVQHDFIVGCHAKRRHGFGCLDGWGEGTAW